MIGMDFKDLREKIENLISDIDKWIAEKSVYESSSRLREAESLFNGLSKIAENDVQRRSIARLEEELGRISEKIKDIRSKREEGKAEDGNIAFKCNWNDKHYKAPCSKKAYEFNIKEGRAWCSSPDCKCRQYKEKVSMEDHPCYESIALKEMYFGAGWDHTGERYQPRHIYSVRQDRMAILTTRPPGNEEKDRLIIGCLYINEVRDDPGAETKIYSDREKSIEVDYDNIKVRFWDYYKNTGDEDLKLWSSGLFRYIADETVLNMLNGINNKYERAHKNIKKMHNLIEHYEKIINLTEEAKKVMRRMRK